MRTLFIALVMLMTLGLSACNSLGGTAPAAAPPVPPTPNKPYDGTLTPPLMDALLLGEIAFNRGQVDVAAQQYAFAARYTHDAKIAERATHIAFYAGKDKLALEMARIWEHADPQNRDIPQVLGLLTLRNGDVSSSLKYWRRVLQAKGSSPQRIFQQMGRLLADEQDKAAVMQLMGELLKHYSKLPEAQLSYARLAIEAKQYSSAEAAMTKALKLRHGWWQVYVLKAHMYIQQGKTQEAELAMAKAVRVKPKDIQLRLRYARMLFEAGQYRAAKQQFLVLVKLRPKDADVRFALGILYVQLEEYTQAERQFRYLVAHGQRVDDASYYLGSLAEQEGDLAAAKVWYSRVRGGENAYHAVRRLVFIMARENGLDSALDYLHRISSESGSDAIRLMLLEGELLTETQHYQQAFDHYTKALGSYPDSFDLRYSRAMVAEKLNKLDVLEKDLRTILKTDPKNVDALNALGYTLADRTDRVDEAYKLIKQALELKPNNGPIMDSMGWVLYKMGRLKEAVPYLQRAYRILHDGDVAAHLGEVYWQLGQKSKAKTLWQSAAKRNPDNELLQKTMKRFLK